MVFTKNHTSRKINDWEIIPFNRMQIFTDWARKIENHVKRMKSKKLQFSPWKAYPEMVSKFGR